LKLSHNTKDCQKAVLTSQVNAENYVINHSWDANGKSFNLADSIGIMEYDKANSLKSVKSYTNGPDNGAGKYFSTSALYISTIKCSARTQDRFCA
jgi:hypothetical protein